MRSYFEVKMSIISEIQKIPQSFCSGGMTDMVSYICLDYQAKLRPTPITSL